MTWPRMTWPRMVWIGGAPGAGKSTIARDIARRRDLPLHPAACRQGRLWQEDIGPASLPPYPFACECGRSGCAAVWSGTPDQYDVLRADGWLAVC